MNGFAAESMFDRLIRQIPRVKGFTLPDSPRLVAIANSTPIGKHRLKTAYPYLLGEYGRQVRSGDRVVPSLDWNEVPAPVVLDYVFGIDRVVSLLGYTVGIDITTDDGAIDEKIAKLNRLRPMWSALDIDNVCVLRVRPGLSVEAVWAALKTVTKQTKVQSLTA